MVLEMKTIPLYIREHNMYESKRERIIEGFLHDLGRVCEKYNMEILWLPNGLHIATDMDNTVHSERPYILERVGNILSSSLHKIEDDNENTQ